MKDYKLLTQHDKNYLFFEKSQQSNDFRDISQHISASSISPFLFSASVLTYDIFFKSLFNLNTGNVCFTENFFQPLRCSAKLIKSLNLATTLRKRIDNKEIYQSGLTLTI